MSVFYVAACASDLNTQQGVVGRASRCEGSLGELKVKHSHDQNHRMAVKRWNIKSTRMKAMRDKFCSLRSVYSVDRQFSTVHSVNTTDRRASTTYTHKHILPGNDQKPYSVRFEY